MTNPRQIPDHPLEFIKRCVRERKLFWTWHVNMRLEERAISRDMILKARESYEIIEAYPDDKYLPSFLIWAKTGDKIFHVLFACDMGSKNSRVITAYWPRPQEWSEDGKRRRT